MDYFIFYSCNTSKGINHMKKKPNPKISQRFKLLWFEVLLHRTCFICTGKLVFQADKCLLFFDNFTGNIWFFWQVCFFYILFWRTHLWLCNTVRERTLHLWEICTWNRGLKAGVPVVWFWLSKIFGEWYYQMVFFLSKVLQVSSFHWVQRFS